MRNTAQKANRTDSGLNRSFASPTSEPNPYGTASAKKLRAKFVESDKAQLAAQIKDLEKSLQINKELLTELITNSKIDTLTKNVLEKMTSESKHISEQLKKAHKERDDAQAKLLISEQMVESLKEKENEITSECEEKVQELSAELDRTEFDIQRREQRFCKAEMLLKKHEAHDTEIKSFLKFIKDETIKENPQKLTNILDEKEELGKELSAAKKRIEELEIEQHDLITLNSQLKLSINEFKVFGAKVASGNIMNTKPAVPALDFTKIRRIGDKSILPEPSYVHKLEESIKYLSKRTQELEEENRNLLQKNMQLENSNANLLKLNTTLSNSIQDLQEKLGQKKPAPRRPTPTPAQRLISSPNIKENNSKDKKPVQIIHLRQITDFGGKSSSNVKPTNNKQMNNSFAQINEDPSMELKKGREILQKAEKIEKIEKESESGTAEKEQSFGENNIEFEKN